MAQLSQSKDKLVASGAAIFAISNESGPDLKKMQTAEKADFITFLSDPDKSIAKLYPGVVPGEKAATFVIGKDKKIAYAYINDDYTNRAGASEVLAALEKAK